LGGTRRLRPAAARAAGAARGGAGALRPGRAAHLRFPQHPLHDLDPHRHLGDGQAHSLRPAAARRQADRLGLRLGSPPPPDLQPLAGGQDRRSGAGPRPRRHLHPARGLQPAGLRVVDGQQVFLEARRIKTADEIGLLATACTLVDAAYEELYDFLRPGVRENECVGLVSKVLYDLGSEHVEGVNAISGERCSPHPHVYSDRVLRPGDPAFFDILHSFNGYRTCYYRTFAVGSASHAMRDAYRRCRDYMDEAISLVKPGATSADIVAVWPRATEFGFANEEAAFALQYGHGVGLSIWEKPIFSRLVSLDHPETLETGMVFALETYWPAADGWSAARIE